jgi:hypothetical protein
MNHDREFEIGPSINQLINKLEIIKQRLLVCWGALLMFVFLSILNPETWEVGPLPFVWGAFILAPIAFGIYLIKASPWRGVPLRERRACIIGSFTISLLAIGFLPLNLILHGEAQGIPFGLIVLFIGIVLRIVYRKLGQYTDVPLDDDIFL